MLIKRVVIQGFKTFAKRTEFLFDPGITAVVGPNGSGKSNIVDAVRWCLGEQSFSLIRSKKTSDIIFSGSDKKARLGMAQVSLLLDNSGGEIPLDFAEVEITRRAYRDGDNEYFVNRQKVRLQDITQILAQTGLGKRTYAVIGQGLIDRVLSLAPEERRSLFEEAAGLTGYHAKRETTVRRLDDTHVNLTRVRDITSELATRLGSLKRQADRAQEREQHANDLRGLLREWYGFKWHAALAEVEAHRIAATALQRKIDARQAELAATGADIERLRADQAGLRVDLGERHRDAALVHREADAVGRQLAIAIERQRHIGEWGQEIDHELVPLRVQFDALTHHIDALQGSFIETQAEVQARRSELAATEAALGRLRLEQDALRAEVESARRTLESLRQRAAEAQAAIFQLQERRVSLQSMRSDHAHSYEAAQVESATANAARASAERAFAGLEVHIEAIQAAHTESESRRNAVRRSLEEAETGRRAADRDVDRLQTRLELLNRLVEEGAGMASGVRAVLQANLPGILGVMGTLLHVPTELERAVESALGGALQNVVAATWEDAQRAIDHLKRGQRGRATFLPLDRLYTSAAIAAPRMEGVFGNAAELVGCEPGVEAARDHLLNRTWITRDLATARRALDARREGPRPTVVTLEGDIVRPGGAVSGGSDSERRDDASMLARAREQRDLPAQVAAARVLSHEAAARCQNLAREGALLDAELEESRRTLAELAREERAKRAELDHLRRLDDQTTRHLTLLAGQIAAADAEEFTVAERLASLQADIVALRQQQADASETLGVAESAAGSAASDALLRELANRRAAEAGATGALASSRSLLDQQLRTLADLETQIRTKESRRDDLHAEAQRLAVDLQVLGAREQTLSARLSYIQSDIAPQEARIEALHTKQEGVEQHERGLQVAQRADESAWTHASLALQRGEDAVNQLRAEIERDLGLVTLEQSEEVAYQPPLPIDAFVQQLRICDEVSEGLEGEMAALRGRLGRLVNINPDAPREYDEAAQRYEFLTAQADDLESAADDLRKVIAELDLLMRTELSRTFRAVAEHFKIEFEKLFNGGTAELILTEPDNIAESGIEIVARPPGKRPQSLALLSGGERSLAACALIFAILRVSPTPFCVLDEVDAALDEANVDRFRMSVEDLSEATQFIIVTHNRRTLEGSNTIYGVTMGDDGVSRVISLRLEGGHIVHHTRPEEGSAPAPGERDLEATDDLDNVERSAEVEEIEEVVRM